MNEVEAAAKAHCDYFGGEGWWDTGLIADTKPKALDAMLAAIAALDAARGDQVARVVEWLRKQQANADARLDECTRERSAINFASASVTCQLLADAIERGEPFHD